MNDPYPGHSDYRQDVDDHEPEEGPSSFLNNLGTRSEERVDEGFAAHIGGEMQRQDAPEAALTTQPYPQEVRRPILASRLRRFVAKTVDTIIVSTIFFGAMIGWMTSLHSDYWVGPIVLMVLFGFVGISIVGFLYNTIFVGFWGTTIGKRMVGIRVVNELAEPPGFGRAFGRALGEVFSGLGLGVGYLFALFDRQKRALHDHLCGTRVILR